MNYHDRDVYGIYNNPQFASPSLAQGPGPYLMGAETLIGNNVVKQGIYPLRYYLDSVNMYKCGCVYQVSRATRILVVRH